MHLQSAPSVHIIYALYIYVYKRLLYYNFYSQFKKQKGKNNYKKPKLRRNIKWHFFVNSQGTLREMDNVWKQRGNGQRLAQNMR